MKFEVRIGPALPLLLQYMLRVSSTRAFLDLPSCAIAVAQAYLKRNPLDQQARQVVDKAQLPVVAAAQALPAPPGLASSSAAVSSPSLSGELAVIIFILRSIPC